MTIDNISLDLLDAMFSRVWQVLESKQQLVGELLAIKEVWEYDTHQRAALAARDAIDFIAERPINLADSEVSE